MNHFTVINPLEANPTAQFKPERDHGFREVVDYFSGMLTAASKFSIGTA